MKISDKKVTFEDLNVMLHSIPQLHVVVLSLLCPTVVQFTTSTNQQEYSALINPILTTKDIQVGEAGTINIDSTLSDHKATYILVVLQ